jgi:hypothetical protein
MLRRVKELDDAVDKLESAPARYDSGWRGDTTGCLDGTRVELLDEIDRWVTKTVDTAPIFWLNGLAGTGKSSIAYTVAERCCQKEWLGASFFFSRSESTCTKAHLFFTTIARQFASFDPELKTLIAKAIIDTKYPNDVSIRIQFQNFIVAPLRSLGRRPPLVVVVDALDECSSEQGIKDILQLIAAEARHIPFLRFLITSRPEHHIRDYFTTYIAPMAGLVVLHEIGQPIVRSDIKHFLNHRLSTLGPSTPWPTSEEIKSLVEYAAEFFIFAATAVKFIEGDKEEAQSRLNVLLKVREPRLHSPYGDLDALYLRILQDALPQNARPELKKIFQRVVGSIVLLFDPIPLPALEALLELKTKDARFALKGLHSVVIVPASDSEAARIWHPSFHDFLTDPQRCIDSEGGPDQRFYVDRFEHHRRIAISCLRCMTSALKQDICEIKDFSKSNDEVEDLQQRINDNIPRQLQYSCMHWTSHVSCASPTDELISLLQNFFQEFFLHWLEALSLIAKLEVAVKDLPIVTQWYRVSSQSRTTNTPLIPVFSRRRRILFLR